MITKVRIAPREQWGKWHLTKRINPGDEIKIETGSCAVDPKELNLGSHPLGSRWWLVSDDDVLKYAKSPRNRWICEHMLEID